MKPYWTYHDGAFKPLDQVSIALNDMGFVMGVTATDQCRTYGQQPFRLFDHILRFYRSCELCGVACPVQRIELKRIIDEVLERNVPIESPGAEWSIVWFATPGVVGSFLGQAGTVRDASPRLTVYAFPIDAGRFADYYERGAELRLARKVTSPPASVIHPHAKQRSRLHWWLAEGEVKHQYPNASALLLDPEGHVTETASCNVLLVRDGEVFSPRRSRILPGVSLLVVEELCAKEGIRFREADLKEAYLATAEEAMICSTPFGIAPVGLLEGRRLPVDGEMFARLWRGWKKMIQATVTQAQWAEKTHD
ncbi:MAG TPA: aminotransferase class IV [Gemmatales bacterium]|nr:aminotransferase class IV [Gemmatales bacterium]